MPLLLLLLPEELLTQSMWNTVSPEVQISARGRGDGVEEPETSASLPLPSNTVSPPSTVDVCHAAAGSVWTVLWPD
jgi:hypothetical protein